MPIHPLAGKPAPAELLIDVAALERAYYANQPDLDNPAQRVAFGTSGDRGTSLDSSFTEAHILATTQAICEQRKAAGITGPVFNAYSFGGYLIFSGIPAFIDGRADMYGDDFMRRHLEAIRHPWKNGLDELLDEYRVCSRAPIWAKTTSCVSKIITAASETTRMVKHAKIFVSGHRGMVGSALVRRLLAGGYTNLLTRTHAELDLTDQRAVHAYLAEHRPDYIVIAAAKVGGIQANNQFRAEFLYQNLMIEANLIHGAHLAGVQRLMFLASSCIYPRAAAQPITEHALLTGPLE